MGALQTLRTEGGVIVHAPYSFAICLLAIAAVIFLVIKKLKAQEIADLNSRLTLRNDEIADYKRKLDGATPDEAKARLDAMEKKIAELEERLDDDPDAIFQAGKDRGGVSDPVDDGNVVKFRALFGDEGFDPENVFEWRGLTLKISKSGVPEFYNTMGVKGVTIEHLECAVINRP